MQARRPKLRIGKKVDSSPTPLTVRRKKIRFISKKSES
jgi:hypothetical protein